MIDIEGKIRAARLAGTQLDYQIIGLYPLKALTKGLYRSMWPFGEGCARRTHANSVKRYTIKTAAAYVSTLRGTKALVRRYIHWV